MALGAWKDARLARTAPARVRQRAVDLAREGAAPVAKIAEDLGISESCLRNWMEQADADDGDSGNRPSSAEKKELAELQRRNQLMEQENSP